MGWLQGTPRTISTDKTFDFSKVKEAVKYVEEANTKCSDDTNSTIEQKNVQKETEQQFPFQSDTTPDQDFPFIPKDIVASKRRPGALAKGSSASDSQRRDYWIVVDNMVYDCTDFILDHPGGEQVIMSFLGQDCSWQFWRFHGKAQMDQYGRSLRIGRTEGVENRFQEPKRYVGLSRLGHDEW